MKIMRKNLLRYGIFAGSIGFIFAALGFAIAYFTIDIPSTNSFVNTQSTIVQYADGQEIGRLG